MRPAVALARMLSNSPLCQADEHAVAAQLAESLAIPEPRLTRIVAEPSTVLKAAVGIVMLYIHLNMREGESFSRRTASISAGTGE